MRRRVNFALVVSIVGVTTVSVWAQTRQDPTSVLSAPQVLSGDAIGVRVLGPPDRKGRVPAAIVVKLNGQWVEVVAPVTPQLIGK